MVILLLSAVGCSFSLPEKAECADPHLWYAPDGSGDTYFGCEPPEGWQETPADEGSFAAVTTTLTPPGDDDDDAPVDTSEPTVVFPPEDTAPPEIPVTGDTGQRPLDTSLPADTADTAVPLEDTSDTGALLEPEPDTADTGLPPIEPTGDTGGPLAPLDTGAPPIDTALPPPVDDDSGTP